MNPLVSIIIPVYNVEMYLKRCLDSVLVQTYEKYEVIIVNDGSTDGSLEICKRYSENYEKINFYNQTNQGVSEARNLGLSKAKGELVCFIDADDFVSDIYIETLYMNMVNENADISMCNSTRESVFDENGDSKTMKWDNENAIMQFLQNEKFDATVGGKLFKKSVLRNLRFEKIKIGEDQIFLFQALENSQSVVYSDVRLYCYFVRPFSAMEGSFDKRFWDAVYMAEWFGKEAVLKYPKLEDLLYKKEIYSYVILILIAIKYSTNESKEIIKAIKPRVVKSRYSRIKKYCSKTEKYKYLMVKYMLDIVRIYLRTRKKNKKPKEK